MVAHILPTRNISKIDKKYVFFLDISYWGHSKIQTCHLPTLSLEKICNLTQGGSKSWLYQRR